MYRQAQTFFYKFSGVVHITFERDLAVMEATKEVVFMINGTLTLI